MTLKQEILSLSKKLIYFPSVSSDLPELVKITDFVESLLKQIPGLQVKRLSSNQKPSLIATFKKTKSPEIFLNGHLDVIPAEKSQFNPVVKNGKLFGRGAQDMKANIAVFIVLLRELVRRGKQPNLGLMFVSDEEIAGNDGTSFLLNKGYTCKFFITGEPSNLSIVHCEKGFLWLEVKAKGVSTHGSMPWNGENAILKINQGINRFLKIYPIPKKEAWKTTASVDVISGGDVVNKVPDKCTLKIDFRYIRGENLSSVVEKVKICFKGCEVRIISQGSDLFTNPSDPYIKNLSKAIKNTTGEKAQIVRKAGFTDARFFSEKGIPAVWLGAVGSGLHGKDENVSIKSLLNLHDALFNFLRMKT